MKREEGTSNITKKKLSGLPFESAAEMRKEEDIIVRKAWRDMTRSKVILDLAKRSEFSFFNKIFSQGFSCKLRDGAELLRVTLQDEGLEVEVNPQVAAGSVQIASNMDALIRGLSDTLMRSYLESVGIIQPQPRKSGKNAKTTAES